MLELFTTHFMQRAIVALFLIGMTFPSIGIFIITLELIPARFAVMHAALLGAAFALLLNFNVVIGAIIASLISAVAIAGLSEKSKNSAGGYLGLVMTLSLALAFILFYKANVPAIEAFNLFWGSVLTLKDADLYSIILLSLLIALFLFFFYKEIQAVLYNRELAFVVGVPARAIYFSMLILVCLSIALAIRVTGALLVDAVTILPALAARQVGKNLLGMLLWGGIFGLIINLSGLVFAYLFDLPTSPAIIIVGAALVLGLNRYKAFSRN